MQTIEQTQRRVSALQVFEDCIPFLHRDGAVQSRGLDTCGLERLYLVCLREFSADVRDIKTSAGDLP
jgi:hypothetical protein